MLKPLRKKTNKPVKKVTQKSWADLKNDKEQQKIYSENVSFIADLHTKYGCK